MWYVDGAYVASGANLSYKFESEGVHFVKAKIGGYFTSATTFKVVENENDDAGVLAIASISAMCALGVCLVCVVATILVKKKRSGNN
jgi:hypothetical protein